MSEENKAFIRRYVATYNSHDVDAFAALYADDCITQTMRGDVDKPTLMESAASAFKAFPDLQAVEDSIVAEGDRVMARYTFRGTQKGDFRGIPASGKMVEWKAMVEFRIANGKVAESWNMANREMVMQKMGLVPS